jgi:hypothetical protein
MATETMGNTEEAPRSVMGTTFRRGVRCWCTTW